MGPRLARKRADASGMRGRTPTIAARHVGADRREGGGQASPLLELSLPGQPRLSGFSAETGRVT